MAMIDVAGPLKSETEANETARYLGAASHSVYSRAVKDSDGYDTDARVWYVERDADALPDTVFGHSWAKIHLMQRGGR